MEGGGEAEEWSRDQGLAICVLIRRFYEAMESARNVMKSPPASILPPRVVLLAPGPALGALIRSQQLILLSETGCQGPKAL